MPIYELECTRCGKKEEKLFTTYVNFLTPRQAKQRRRKERREVEKANPGYTVIHAGAPPKPHRPKCGFCGGDQILLASKTNMQPDRYWAGQVVHGKYVTKKSEVSQDIEPATRDRIEHVKKRKAEVRKEFEEKSAKNLKNYLTEQLAGVTIEPDGNTLKEKKRDERKRTATE